MTLSVDPAIERRVAKLEADLKLVIWLHAELTYALRLAVAMQYIQQPQVQQAMVEQMMAGST